MTKIIEKVTITEILSIFKNDEPANAIEVVHFKYSSDEECGYDIVAQKGLYEIGSTAYFIQPDYCLSDIPLFESFLRPNGDPSKSKLKANYRIRAIKFNFTFENESNPIYSCGILLPEKTVLNYLRTLNTTGEKTLDELLGVSKYEEPEEGSSGLTGGEFPSYLYKTDEPTLANSKKRIARIVEEKQRVGITIKHDGSSFSGFCKKTNYSSDYEYDIGVCSRNLRKKLEQFYTSGYKDAEDNQYHPYWNQDLKEKGWYCDVLESYKTDDEIIDLIPVVTEVKDTWVELAKKNNLLGRFTDFCRAENLELALRGEIYGQGLKGSGTKHNPDKNEKQTLRLFGADDLSSGYSVRLNYSDKYNLKTIAEILDVPYTHNIIEFIPESYEHLVQVCRDIFDTEKAKGRIIEGLVIRTLDTNDLSCKYINELYDSKL